MIEVEDSGEDTEGRIVHHHAALGIVVVFIVATGIEGAYDGHIVGDVVGLTHILNDGIIVGRRRVAVFCGLLRFERLDEAVVVVEFFFVFGHGVYFLPKHLQVSWRGCSFAVFLWDYPLSMRGGEALSQHLKSHLRMAFFGRVD